MLHRRPNTFWLICLMVVAVPSLALAWGHEIKDAKTGDPQFLSTTQPNDFLGRWTLKTVTYESQESSFRLRFDIVPCGKALCAIKLSDKDECQQTILTVADNGPDKTIIEGDELASRYTGLVDWPDKVAKYYVAVDILGQDSDSDKADPTTRRLTMDGYPASDGTPSSFGSRMYPISADFAYVGPAACHMPSS